MRGVAARYSPVRRGRIVNLRQLGRRLMDVRQLRLDLCEALGIADPGSVRRVVLVIDANAIPLLRVTRIVRDAAGLRQVAQRYQLRPLEVPDGAVRQVPTPAPADPVYEWFREARGPNEGA